MNRTVVINAVGLSESLLGVQTPAINALRDRGTLQQIQPAFPAVTCTAQSNYLTGQPPSAHGIVGNGWYNRELSEVHFWKQSNHLVRGRKIWDDLRAEAPGFTCANLFWWFNMVSTVDWAVTPRPMYPADGRKLFDIYSWPYDLRVGLKRELGDFPFPGFWGPAAGQDTPQGPSDVVSRWIAAAAKWVEEQRQPTLSLVYLPHLDYNLQRFGPGHPCIPDDVQRIDSIVGDLVEFFEKRSVQVLLLSEYGISSVNQPIHLNRLFREQGWVTIKEELGLELLDCGASRVFAVADHQIAHVYLNDRTLESSVRALLERQPGVESVLGTVEKQARGLGHERAGDFIAVSQADAWFTYYYWMDDARAPDFARTVDIHRKPGFDPVELFLDPEIRFARGKIMRRLLQKKLGFRMLMDVIPLDATLVRGSHGAIPANHAEWPIIVGPSKLLSKPGLVSTEVHGIIKQTVLG